MNAPESPGPSAPLPTSAEVETVWPVEFCLSGDCPHTRYTDCIAQLKADIAEHDSAQHAASRAAVLSELAATAPRLLEGKLRELARLGAERAEEDTLEEYRAMLQEIMATFAAQAAQVAALQARLAEAERLAGEAQVEAAEVRADREYERTKRARAEVLYNELLYAVAKKHHDETRHATALRYIQQAEDQSQLKAATVRAAPHVTE
jgi:hypothetical protein